MTMNDVLKELGRTLRYCLDSSARTARLATLIIIIVVIYYLFSHAPG